MAKKSKLTPRWTPPKVEFKTAKYIAGLLGFPCYQFEIVLTQEFNPEYGGGHYKYVIYHCSTMHIASAGCSMGGPPDGDAMKHAVEMMDHFLRDEQDMLKRNPEQRDRWYRK